MWHAESLSSKASSSPVSHRRFPLHFLPGRLLEEGGDSLLVSSLLVLAAVILILGHEGGIYLLAPALIAVLAEECVAHSRQPH